VFGIGLPEVIVILLLIVIVVGPEQLPGVVRKGAAFLREARSNLAQIRASVDRQAESLTGPLQSIHDKISQNDASSSREEAENAPEQGGGERS